jgi:DinB superfamily
MISQELMHEYLDGVAALRQATDGMTADQSRARPVPGKWSTLEVVCHLADIDALDAERMKRVIAEDQPTLMDADENTYAAALAYQERELGEEVALIESTRRQMTRILRTLPSSALSRGSVYRIGDKTENRTLEQLLNKAIRHFRHHIPFILEKRKALGM